ncbi:MAG: hypothetical protein LBJ88_04225 [Campylobacteraceae bacterium]|jgi:hypothetical protein|nr:hypothetical protein [Campylobacteraceae bacterium]
MKRVFVCFVLCFECLYAFCFCEFQLQQAYDGINNKVEEYINNQKDAVGKLIDEIKKNTKDIKEQNKVIEKIIEGEKRKALQNAEIVFLLQKIVELKTAGEM